MLPASSQGSLKNTLLIAMPRMDDPNFSGAVIYLCEHNEEGAMGLVINQPLSIPVDELFSAIEVPYEYTRSNTSQKVFLGGPVDQEHGFVLHTYSGTLDEQVSMRITEDIALTSSKDIFVDIGKGEGPGLSLIALGYAGWGAGQLEEELAANVWLNSPVDKTILFTSPFEERLGLAAARIGVNLAMLSPEAGHA